MAENFWFKFYFKDWSDDVKPLSLAARGLLIELIIELRKRGGQMPVDIRLMVRLTGGLTEEITGGLDEFREHGIFDFENTSTGEIMRSRKISKELSKSLTNKENGKKGGNPKLISVNPLVTKSVNRKDNRSPIFNSNSISNSKIIFPFDSDKFREVWTVWKKYKKEQHSFQYKEISEQAALKKLSKLAPDESTAIQIINQSIESGWQGLFELKASNNGKQQKTAGNRYDPKDLMAAVARNHGIGSNE